MTSKNVWKQPTTVMLQNFSFGMVLKYVYTLLKASRNPYRQKRHACKLLLEPLLEPTEKRPSCRFFRYVLLFVRLCPNERSCQKTSVEITVCSPRNNLRSYRTLYNTISKPEARQAHPDSLQRAQISVSLGDFAASPSTTKNALIKLVSGLGGSPY